MWRRRRKQELTRKKRGNSQDFFEKEDGNPSLMGRMKVLRGKRSKQEATGWKRRKQPGFSSFKKEAAGGEEGTKENEEPARTFELHLAPEKKTEDANRAGRVAWGG